MHVWQSVWLWVQKLSQIQIHKYIWHVWHSVGLWAQKRWLPIIEPLLNHFASLVSSVGAESFSQSKERVAAAATYNQTTGHGHWYVGLQGKSDKSDFC